ncbi:MAG: sodium/proline symporter PutP [Clostridium sp.]|nr:sodium/proline symporter PutP [Acetatifactor muris]MCM1526433.1 sodium/proline symporter PutP [Bacteroides sp.]MCM1563204.1 sodium/proline symporter PutP [Clostridium sp.]
MTQLIWMLVAFAAYLILMVGVGAYYSGKNASSEDYFLGGRKLGGFVAALSAQASDMSGWLLMGLPGSIYLIGVGGDGWVALGLFIGTTLNWLLISKRLRRYTIRANNSLTLPSYFENRFHDNRRILMVVSSVTIVIFFLVYCASALAAGGQLFESLFGWDYRLALTIGAVVILIYTFLGGFSAVCLTDFIQGMLMLVALLAVPIMALIAMKGDGLTVSQGLALNSALPGTADDFVNIMKYKDGNNTFVNIISGLGWGLGYFGMPHILVRFMAVKDEKELKKSKVVAILWVALSLFFACLIGVIGRAFLAPDALVESGSEKVFIHMIVELLSERLRVPFIAGLFLCGILAAIMSTADSQLLVSASSVAEDIYKGLINKKADNKKVLLISRITVMVIAVVAYIIALDPQNTIMGLVSNAWAGLGAAFGPLVLMSLFWKRCNFQGAVAGIVSGALTVIIWDYIPLVSGSTIGAVTGLYSLVVGFAVSLLMIVIVSLCTKAPSAEMLQEFEDVNNNKLA